MKKRVVAILSMLLALPAFAEVYPVSFDEQLEYSDGDFVSQDSDEIYEDAVQDASGSETSTTGKATSAKTGTATGRVTPSRAVSSTNRTGSTAVSASRSVATRGGTAGTVNTTGTSGRGTTVARTVSNRGVTTSRTQATNGSGSRAISATRTSTTNANKTGTTRTVNTNGTRNGVSSRAAISTTATRTGVTRATNTTGANTNRAATDVNTARVSVLNSDTATSALYKSNRVSSRMPTLSISSGGSLYNATGASTVSQTDVSSAVSEMNDLTEITDYCKAQYAKCMDGFCNVLDDNQGRCSCSANIEQYAKTEQALKKVTEELQEVAQKIQYIGLSAEEVESVFTQTEAEVTMQSTQDTSQIKTSLDKIRDMIIDVQTGKSSSSSDMNFDLSGLLDFNFSSSGFDLSSLFGLGSGTSSINNQRGSQLYKTAQARCKSAVLDTCTSQGVSASIVTNSYDMEIDKQCLVYERALEEENTQMSATVLNAKNVLQQARYLVAQQKNQYNQLECINKLDECMQDEYVCGTDYENCLDPTGRFISNGSLQTGSKPGIPGGTVTNNLFASDELYGVWNYSNGNAWESGGNLIEYINSTLQLPDENDQTTLSGYLQYKIGYNSNDRNYGMCMSVLNKCQKYTYDTNGNYNPRNDIIREYLQRSLIKIKTVQDTLLADYAESCVPDVISCLAKNGFDISDEEDNNGTISDITKPKNIIAIRTCLPTVTTCMSVLGINDGTSLTNKTVDAKTWVCAINGGNCSGGGGSVITPGGGSGGGGDKLPDCGTAKFNPDGDKCTLTATSGSIGNIQCASTSGGTYSNVNCTITKTASTQMMYYKITGTDCTTVTGHEICPKKETAQPTLIVNASDVTKSYSAGGASCTTGHVTVNPSVSNGTTIKYCSVTVGGDSADKGTDSGSGSLGESNTTTCDPDKDDITVQQGETLRVYYKATNSSCSNSPQTGFFTCKMNDSNVATPGGEATPK